MVTEAIGSNDSYATRQSIAAPVNGLSARARARAHARQRVLVKGVKVLCEVCEARIEITCTAGHFRRRAKNCARLQISH